MTTRKVRTPSGEAATVNIETGEILRVTPAPLADTMLDNEYQPFFKTPYNHDTLADARAHGYTETMETKTQQNTRDDVDINNILARFGVAAVRRPPTRFVDVPEDLDMATAITRIRDGQDAFNALPQNVQQHFETLSNYLDFVDQAIARGDRKSLEQLNLLKPTEAPPAPPGAAQAAPNPTPAPGASPAPTPAPTAPTGAVT